MLSRLFSSLKAQTHSSPSTTHESKQAEKQLLAELAEAVEAEMVSTRSHDDASENVATINQTNGTPPSVKSKRKRIDVDTDTTPAQDANKRRRTPAKAVAVVIDRTSPKSPHGASPVGPEDSADISIEVANLNPQELEPNPSTTSKEPPMIISRVSGEEIDAERNSEIKYNTPYGSEQVRGVAKETLDELIAAAKETEAVEPMTSENGRNHKKQRSSKEAKTAVTSTPEDPRLEGGNVKPVNAPQATHKRFGSEDVGAPEPQLVDKSHQTELVEEIATDNADESENEAPDTVTAAAGYDQVRIAAAEAARVAERQDAAQRKKRREIDHRLKSQATSAKKQSKSDIQTRVSGKDPLPAFLPDEILAAERIIRSPTPPSSLKAPVSKKRRLLEMKPPKDLKRGNTKIRVLQVEQTNLPPKSTTASRKVREAWLTGQRGLLSGVGVPRRKSSGGFVRM